MHLRIKGNHFDLHDWGNLMTSYTFSHISLDGGSVAITNKMSHWTHLGNDKYLIVYCQQNPNHVHAQIMTYNGPTELPTLGPICAIRTNMPVAPSLVRVFGHATKALVYFGEGTSILEALFLEIAPDDTITPAQSVSTLFSDISAVSNADRLVLVRLTDTVHRLIYFTQTSMLSVNTMVVDFDAETISTTTDSVASSVQMLDYYYTAIPTTSEYFEHFAGRSFANIITDTATLVRTVDVSSWQSTKVSFVSATKGFSIQSSVSNTKVFVIDNFVWPSGAVACGSYGISYPNTLISLDTYHVMAICETSQKMTALVSRLYTPHIGDTSPASKNVGGIVLNLGGVSNLSFWNSNHYAPHRVDDETYLYWFITGVGSSAKIGYKSLYQSAS